MHRMRFHLGVWGYEQFTALPRRSPIADLRGSYFEGNGMSWAYKGEGKGQKGRERRKEEEKKNGETMDVTSALSI